jgi:hypothetical protein
LNSNWCSAKFFREGRAHAATSRAPAGPRRSCPARLPNAPLPEAARHPKPHLPTHLLARGASNRAVEAQYARRARGGPPVRSRHRPYARRPRLRSTEESPVITPPSPRARAYKRPSSSSHNRAVPPFFPVRRRPPLVPPPKP